MKNKKIKTLIISLLIIITIILIFFAIDIYRLRINKEPIFCINTITYRDGGSKEYLGIGYKIITYNSNNRQDFEVGTWFLKYNWLSHSQK